MIGLRASKSVLLFLLADIGWQYSHNATLVPLNDNHLKSIAVLNALYIFKRLVLVDIIPMYVNWYVHNGVSHEHWHGKLRYFEVIPQSFFFTKASAYRLI